MRWDMIIGKTPNGSFFSSSSWIIFLQLLVGDSLGLLTLSFALFGRSDHLTYAKATWHGLRLDNSITWDETITLASIITWANTITWDNTRTRGPLVTNRQLHSRIKSCICNWICQEQKIYIPETSAISVPLSSYFFSVLVKKEKPLFGKEVTQYTGSFVSCHQDIYSAYQIFAPVLDVFS